MHSSMVYRQYQFLLVRELVARSFADWWCLSCSWLIGRRKVVEGQAHSATVDELCWKGMEVEVNLPTTRTQLFAVGVVESLRPVAQLEKSSLVPLAQEALLTVTWLSLWKWDFYIFCVSLPYLSGYNSGASIVANDAVSWTFPQGREE